MSASPRYSGKPRGIPDPTPASRQWARRSFARDPLAPAREAGFQAGLAGEEARPPDDVDAGPAYMRSYRQGVRKRNEDPTTNNGGV